MTKLVEFTQNTISTFEITQQSIDIRRHINQHAYIWLKKADDFSTLKDIIIKAVTQKVYELDGNRKIIAPLQFNLLIINEIFSKLENSNNLHQGLNKFIDYAGEILNKTSTDIQTFSQQLGDIPIIPTATLQTLVEQLKQAAQAMHSFNQETYELKNISIVNILSTAIKTFDSLIISFQSLTKNEVTAISTKLFQGIVAISQKDISLQQNVDTTLQALHKLKDAIQGNSLEIARKEMELKQLQIKVVELESNSVKLLKEIGQGFNLVGGLLVATGNNELIKWGQHATIVGQAGVEIAGTVMTLVTMNNPLTGFMAISNAATVLFKALGGLGLFQNGPSKEDQLLQQIAQLAIHLDKRFDRLEAMLGKMHEQMHGRFDRLEKILDHRFNRLEKLLGKAYTDIIKQFIEVKKGVINLQHAVEHVGNQVIQLEQKLDAKLITLHLQGYTTLKQETFIDLPRQRKLIDSNTFRSKIADYPTRFLKWAIIEAKENILAGVLNSGYDAAKICQEIFLNGDGIEYKINLLVDYISRAPFNIKLNKHQTHYETRIGQNTRGLINPVIWTSAVLNYMKLIKEVPELILEDYQQEISDMIEVGKEFNEFVLKIKTNVYLFQNLCAQYRDKLKAVLYSSYNLIFNVTVTRSDFPEQVLNIVDALDKGSLVMDELKNDKKISSSCNPFTPMRLVPRHPDQVTDRSAANDYAEMYYYERSKLEAFRNFSTELKANIRPRQLEILSQAITKEKADAINKNRLPHCLLVEKFFSLLEHKVRKEYNSKLQQATKNNQAFINALEELNTAYQLLSIFVAFAFNKDYLEDNQLSNFLKIDLWDSADFTTYLANYDADNNNNNGNNNSSPDFILLAMQKKVFKNLDQFEILLLEKILEAEDKQKNNVKQSIYSLIDNTLESLEEFKTIYSSAKRATPTASPSHSSKHFEEGNDHYDNAKLKMKLESYKSAYKFFQKAKVSLQLSPEFKQDGEEKVLIEKRLSKIKDKSQKCLINLKK